MAHTGGNLGLSFTNTVSIGRASRVANQSPNPFSMTFSISTFRGSVVDPVNGDTVPFSGVAFQKNAAGYGFLAGTDQTSTVLLGLWRVE